LGFCFIQQLGVEEPFIIMDVSSFIIKVGILMHECQKNSL